MKKQRRIFIGYETNNTEPFYVCRQSLINVGVNPSIIEPIILPMVQDAGWFWRTDIDKGSTQFTNTRFLVPFLSGYYGQSIFCDHDFLWRKNPDVLFDLMEAEPNYSVRVVHHDIQESDLSQTKMNGKPQVFYPRKNWSSMMVFNNAHVDCRSLTPENVSTKDAQWLHQFHWSGLSPTLPKSFNHLVGYRGYDNPDPYAVHYTDGGPWLEEYKNVEYAEEWFRVQQATERPVY